MKTPKIRLTPEERSSFERIEHLAQTSSKRVHAYVTRKTWIAFETPRASMIPEKTDPIDARNRFPGADRNGPPSWILRMRRGTRRNVPAPVVWNTPWLVLCGVPPRVALARLLEYAGAGERESLAELLRESGIGISAEAAALYQRVHDIAIDPVRHLFVEDVLQYGGVPAERPKKRARALLVLDPMGNRDEERARIVEAFADQDVALEILGCRDVFLETEADDADVVVFDWGGMSTENDLMGHQIRRLARWAEDHPSKLVVIWSTLGWFWFREAVENRYVRDVPTIIGMIGAPFELSLPAWWLAESGR